VRKLVGFGASNTVVEEVLDDNGQFVIAVRKHLAPVFANMAKMTTILFIKVKLPVESKPMDPTSVARTKLKKLGEILLQQDSLVIFFKYKQTAKDERDASTKLSQIPTTITGIQSYMNGFRPSLESGDVWGSLRIGINEKSGRIFGECLSGSQYAKVLPAESAFTGSRNGVCRVVVFEPQGDAPGRHHGQCQHIHQTQL
jgi:hypothetical protein